MEYWKNKRVWIIGASSGIGEGLVKSLLESGAKVIISARREERLYGLKSAYPGSFLECLPLDIACHQELAGKTGQAWSIWEGLDFVFLNSGISLRDLVSDSKLEVEKKVMDINFWGPVAVAKSLLLQKSPEDKLHLVVTSSLSGKYGVPRLAAYSASKHALHGYFDSLRAEMHRSHLLIHLVIPGFVRTDITISGMKGDGSPYGKMQNALKRGMSPENCARLILKGIQQGKEEFIVGKSEKYTVLFNRLFPKWNRYLIRSNPLQKLKVLKRSLGWKGS